MANIVLVTASTSYSNMDNRINSALVAAGHTVIPLVDDDPEYAGSYDGVVVADSSAAATFAAKYASVAKPVILMENGPWDDYGMSDTGGTTVSDTQWTMQGSHPLTGGLTGNQTLWSSAQSISSVLSSELGPDVIIPAVSGSTPTRIPYFAYDTGGQMFSGTAPARRVAIRLPNAGGTAATAALETLLAAAIDWAFDTAPVLDTVRFYLANEVSPIQNGWTTTGDVDDTTGIQTLLRLSGEPAGPATSHQASESSADAPYWVSQRAWLSAPATGPGVIRDIYDLTVAWFESNSEADFVPWVLIAVMQGDTGTSRALPVNIVVSSYEIPVVGGNASNIWKRGTTNDIPFQAGDRILVHLGWRSDNTSTTARTSTIHYGGTSDPDLAIGDTDFSRPSWIDLQVTPGVTFEEPTPTDPPGSVFDLSTWKWQGPTEDPNQPGDLVEVEGEALTTYVDEHFYLNASNEMVMIAPVQGVTSSGSGGTRSELREMFNGVEADWSLTDPGVHQLTVTMRPDPTRSTDRQEMIVLQIHAGANPSIYLAAEWESGGNPVTPRIRVFKDNLAGGSSGVGNLPGTDPTQEVTLRIRVQNSTVDIFGTTGGPESLPSTPNFSYGVSDFADLEGWYFKVGAYNKSEVQDGGTGDVRNYISFVELIQPDGSFVFDTTRFFLSY
jgi:hypothetical protein